jgi:signal transduction histidine kinase
LPSRTVRSLYQDGDGVLWIGSYDSGLARFKDGKFTRYDIKIGLYNDGVFQILEDARGNFWMSCNHGVYRVRKDHLNEFAEGRRSTITSVAYGKSDGLLNLECNGGRSPAGIKTRDGKLWFPTQDGVVVIDPEKVITNPKPPPVVIESFLLDRAPVSFDSEVKIQPHQGEFEIKYTALSFINSENLRFKYRLEGLEPDWIDVGTRRTAYYSRVPAGEYTFKVIAANSDGVWNEEGKSVKITVLPPFYRTWWFLTLAGLCLLGLAYSVFEFRVNQVEKARKAQEEFSRKLLASQEQERKRIAGELHDSIGQSLAIIRNLALVSLSAPEDHSQAIEQLQEVSTAASEALVEVKAIAHNLRPYQLDRLGLSKAIAAMVKAVSNSSEIRFAADIADLDGILPQEAEINLYRIVQESLNNIVQHSRATEASVIVKRDSHGIHVEIRDNGQGFVAGHLSESSTGGLGLMGITERARIFGAKSEIRSAPGSGTIVTVNVPLEEPLQ